MDLRRYLRLFRRRWLLIVLSIAVCAGAAAALAVTQPPTYVAHSQMFVSGTKAATLGDTYEGGLFIQQRVASYTRILSSAGLVQRVIKQLRLPDSVGHLQSEISASVPAGTVLIDLTVKDRSPTRAQAIAGALAAQFSNYLGDLETPQTDGQPQVRVSVVSPAPLQTSQAPSRTGLDIALGVLIGLVLGVVGAVTLESLDDRVRSEEDVGSIIGAPVLGTIVHHPDADRNPGVALAAPDSLAAESFRRLRANLLAVSGHGPPRSLAILSAMPREGKTFVAANLGIAFAAAGHRVILVNTDMRSRALAHVLGATSTRGLTDVLTANASLDSALHTGPGLPFEMLDSGPSPGDPGEIFESRRFVEVLNALGTRADTVLVDALPLLAEADAAIIAGAVSGVILVVRMGSTRKRELEDTVRVLRTVNAQVVGVVLNGTSPRDIRRYVRLGGAARGASATHRKPQAAGRPPLRPPEREAPARRFADGSSGPVG
jgi:tyrosine-protein kinase